MFYQLFVIMLAIIIGSSTTAFADVYFDNGNLVVTESSSNNDDDKPVRRSRSKKPTKAYKPRPAPSIKSIKSFYPTSRSHLIRWKGHRMPAVVAEKLMEVERTFGPITIISSCRPGATVKNSGRPSMHSYCRAIDFNPPRGKYSQVANFLKSTWSGGVGTYSGCFNHIHIDDNRGRWHN